MNPWSFALFLGTVLLVLGLIHFFLYKQVVSGLGITAPAWRWGLRVLFALLTVSYPVARWLDTFAPDGVVRTAHWIASVWTGLMWHLLWLFLVLLVLRLLARVSGLPALLGWTPAGLARASVLVGIGAAVALSGLGMVLARGPAVVREVAVPMRGVTAELARLRIAVVADLHAGVLVDGDEVERRVAEIQALQPDLVLIPGDVVDAPPARLEDVAAALSKLSAPLGVIASTGNHEYIVGAEGAVAFLREAGLRVLVDERVELPGGLVVAGIADAAAPRFGGTAKPIAEVLGDDARSRPVILLNHTPATDLVETAAAAGADLQLSGHTHGGQIWPFSFLTRLAFPYHHGLYAVGDGYQLTTCGIGWWGPPMRLGAPPEILLVRLVAEGGLASVDGR